MIPMKIKTIISICLTVLIIIALISFIKLNSNDSDNNINYNSHDTSSWTIMIYMSGDNWLNDMIPKNLGHLKSVGSTDEINIIVLVDRRGINNTNLYYIELYDANETSLNALNPKYNDELNMGHKRTLEDFIIWAMDNYPAEHFLLDFWGHGEGWKGVAPDVNDYLTMSELESALKKIVENNNGGKLDIIGFDACDMGMLEVFYQIKDYADYSIASEKEIPEHGWAYYQTFMGLTQNPDMSPIELSNLIVNEYCNAYSSGELDNEEMSVALSVIDLNNMDEIISELQFIPIDRSLLISYENSDYVDLYCYAQINGLDKLMEAVNNTVIKEKHWSNPKGKKINQAYGITIYYPEEYNDDYNKLRFSEDTLWDDGLKNVSFLL